MMRGVPSLFGGRSFTAMAQDACGFGVPITSTRHMRQFPAIDSRSWKQKRGISAPAASHACSSVNSAGTSISLPSMTSLVIAAPRNGVSPSSHASFRGDRRRFRLRARGIGVDAPLDLVAEMPDQPLDRPGRGVAERADRVALDLGGDFEQEPDLALARPPLRHPGEHAPHPAGALAARRALAAALVLVEIG